MVLHHIFYLEERIMVHPDLVRATRKNGGDDDLGTILTRVSRRVAFDKESNIPGSKSLHQKKQIPVRQDTLTR